MPCATSAAEDVYVTDANVSEYVSTSAPHLPWTETAASHHVQAPTVTAPNRPNAPATDRTRTPRERHSWTSHRIGPGAIIAVAVRLTPPTVISTRPNQAGALQPGSRTVRRVSPTSHGRP